MRIKDRRYPEIENEVEDIYFLTDLDNKSCNVHVQIQTAYFEGTEVIDGLPYVRFDVKFNDEKHDRYDMYFWLNKTRDGISRTSVTKKNQQRDRHMPDGTFQEFAQKVYEYFYSPEGAADWTKQMINRHNDKIKELELQISDLNKFVGLYESKMKSAVEIIEKG
jgi:hypothetical protein